MSTANLLRNLPAVDQILRRHEIAAVADRHSRQQLVKCIRHATDACRTHILEGSYLDADQATQFVLHSTIQQLQILDGQRQQLVINATGILLHTNLGRSPLAELAVQRMQQSAGYTNVELNLHSGKRNQRGERICQLFQQLTLAEDACVVNNCAAATMLVLQTLAAGREVIVSRGQLVEIGGGYRLPEVFTASGAVLREVGTTNRTYIKDYEEAISENTGALIKVHRSNFSQHGFVTEPDIADLVQLGHRHQLPVIDDLGSGCLSDLTPFGLHEPTVGASIAAGADLVLFSGDKLFGGPQAGIVVGKRVLIEALRKSPLMRALRVDKMTLAAIEATTEIHLAGNAMHEIPLLQMISRSSTDIQTACQQTLHEIQHLMSADAEQGTDGSANSSTSVESVCFADITIDITACNSQIGGGSVPGSELPSFALRISGGPCDRLAATLRNHSPAVLARIHDGSVILDLRTVNDSQLKLVAIAIVYAIQVRDPDETEANR